MREIERAHIAVISYRVFDEIIGFSCYDAPIDYTDIAELAVSLHSALGGTHLFSDMRLVVNCVKKALKDSGLNESVIDLTDEEYESVISKIVTDVFSDKQGRG